MSYSTIMSLDSKYEGYNYHIASVVDPQNDMLYRFVATVPQQNTGAHTGPVDDEENGGGAYPATPSGGESEETMRAAPEPQDQRELNPGSCTS